MNDFLQRYIHKPKRVNENASITQKYEFSVVVTRVW